MKTQAKKKKVELLQKEANKLLNEIREIEEAEIAEVQIPRLKEMVGNCFAYRENSYGSSVPKWDNFKKILEYHITPEGSFYFITEEFYVDGYGGVSWKTDSHYPYLNKEWWDSEVPFSGYVKITEKEFEDEKVKMLGEMTSRAKLKKALNKKD